MRERLTFKRQITRDTHLNEFVYSLILAIPEDTRRDLPDYLRKHISTAKRAAAFAEKSSTDQKRELLAHLGVGFFWTFAAVDKVTGKEYFQILQEFKKEHNSNAIKEMAEKGLYVTSDKNFAWLLSRMSQCSQSGVYSKNLELVSIANRIRKWPAKMKTTQDAEAEEMIETVEKINKIMSATINQFRYIDGDLKLSKEQLRVLLYYDSFKHSYIAHSKVVGVFLGDINPGKVTYSEKVLVQKLMLQPHVDWKKNEFTITKLGIQAVHKFRDRVLKSINF